MYAHVNVWRLSEAGDSPSTAVAHQLASNLRRQPGFRSYTLIRTGDREVVAVTIFDERDQIEAAVRAVADLVDDRVKPLAAGAPERRHGEVAYQLTADE